MTFPVRFHPLAEDDLLDAWSWYEQRQPGLGDRFLTAVRATLDMVTRWPGSGMPSIENAEGTVIERRVSTAGFPYILRYRTIEEWKAPRFPDSGGVISYAARLRAS